MAYKWVTLEKNFPMTINRASEWIRLKTGECFDVDMIDVDSDGILRFKDKPSPSSAFISKRLTRGYKATIGESEVNQFFAYNRWWRLSSEYGYRLEYTALSDGDNPGASFEAEGYDDYNQDDDTDITLIIPNGEGKMFVVKKQSGYVLSNCMGSSTSFEKSRAFFNIGTNLDEPMYANAVIGGQIAVSWDGGGLHGQRHYLWGGSDETVELSRMVREISEAQDSVDVARINWSSNLVIIDDLVYDLSTRKISHFTGNDYSTFVSRAYTQENMAPIRVSRVSVMTTGGTGSFDVSVEYGQAYDSLSKSKTKRIEVASSTENRFRHEYIPDVPITDRAFRVRIDNLRGEVGVFQVDAIVEMLSDATVNLR